MSDPEDAGVPTPPKPPRPSVRVTPLRDPVPDERPRAVDLAVALWSLCLVALVATAALLALDYRGLRDRLTDVLTAETPGTTAEDIDSTVMITLIAGAAVAVVVLLVGLSGILQIRGRRPSGRSTLTVTGVVTAAGAVAFWIAVSDALVQPTTWAPFVVAGLAVLATAPLYAPAVGKWLSAAPARR
ncbi:hypothetical protein [Rhodococcus sp. MEB064]|uniref:hypothetical protein n=1 Tax=Rhodococcus sp. MEB064 TaxID=1587522 RepID=UPI0005AC6FA2|nr:hypothetical protein [Rhodococcus sp. MEB064]KIQ17425.1 hypothetical protein RU01_09450 [Rhodococcus sp. MEB064]